MLDLTERPEPVRTVMIHALADGFASDGEKQHTAWNPAEFSSRAYPGYTFADYQLDAATRLVQHHRVCWRSPHGVGKTTALAMLILSFAEWCERDGVGWKIATTASSHHQLTHYLWPEVAKWYGRMKPGTWRGRKPPVLLKTQLTGRHGHGFAEAPANAEKIEGAHDDRVLLVYDEAKTIPVPTWDAIEGVFATGDVYAIAASTPGDSEGRFYDIQRGAVGGWNILVVTKEQAIAAGRMRPTFPAEEARIWGEGSSEYIRRVEGNFAADDADSLIPLAWVEAAVERWHALNASGEWGPMTCTATDFAAGGKDKNALAVRHGWAIRSIESWKSGTMETVAKVRASCNGQPAVCDGDGLGAPMVERLMELDANVLAFRAGSSAPDWRDPDLDPKYQRHYANMRAAAWWRLRELLDPEHGRPVALPDDEELRRDLTAPRRGQTSKGDMLVEAKDKVRERIARSTDKGDAVVMAFAMEIIPKRRAGMRVEVF